MIFSGRIVAGAGYRLLVALRNLGLGGGRGAGAARVGEVPVTAGPAWMRGIGSRARRFVLGGPAGAALV